MADLSIQPTAGGLALVGELDFETAPVVADALAPFAGRRATLDLAGLTFMDSSGIKALLSARKAATGIRIINPSIHVRLLLELTGLSHELGVE